MADNSASVNVNVQIETETLDSLYEIMETATKLADLIAAFRGNQELTINCVPLSAVKTK